MEHSSAFTSVVHLPILMFCHIPMVHKFFVVLLQMPEHTMTHTGGNRLGEFLMPTPGQVLLYLCKARTGS